VTARDVLIVIALGAALVSAREVQARASAGQGGDALELSGGPSLTRLAQATRMERLGSIPVYTVTLYASTRVPEPAGLSRSDIAKAVRVDVQYDPGLRPRVPVDWRRELVPNLNAAAVSSLERGFAALEAGDVLIVSYVPGRGTSIRLNRNTIVAEGEHDVMLAFLDHWLGQRPVSQDIKSALVAGFRAP
jgi:hypothetical protein